MTRRATRFPRCLLVAPAAIVVIATILLGAFSKLADEFAVDSRPIELPETALP